MAKSLSLNHRYPKYSTFKKSGINWLGEIPAHWETVPLKHVCYMKGRIGWQGLTQSEFTDTGPFLITGMNFKNGKMNWEDCYHITEERYAEAPEIHVREEDVLITKDGTIGKLLYMDYLPGPTSLNSHLLILRPRNKEYYPKYLFYLLDSNAFQTYVENVKTGTTFFGITQEAMGDFRMLIFDISEQQSIANFLDKETARIDELIAKYQRLIDLLHEKRTALISHAVTRGMDPLVPLKDSGTEWLGKIPDHWNVSIVKRKSKRIQTGTTPPTGDERYYQSEDIPWYGPSSFTKELVLTKPSKFLSTIGITENVLRLFEPGSTLIITIGATIGKVGYLEDSGSSNQQITCITFDTSSIYPKFGAYQLKRLEPIIRALAPNTTLPIIDQQEIGILPIAFPSINEQIQITSFIDKELKNIDDLNSKILKIINLLMEFRVSLISSAVTGKIDVRGL
jgi:type I restriction enzyme, S subunit